MNKKVLSQVFRDPFYAGILDYGKVDPVDLTEVYDFVPTVSVDEFLNVNKFDDIKNAFTSRHRSIPSGVRQAILLNGKVICSSCNNPYHAGLSTKKLKSVKTRRYFYYRCETSGCKNRNKSMRAKVIVDFVVKFLREHPITSKKIYNHFLKEMKKVQRSKQKEDEKRLKSIRQERVQLKRKIDKTKGVIKDESDKELADIWKVDLKANLKALKELDKEIKTLEKSTKSAIESIMSFQEFLELFAKLPDTIAKTTSLEALDSMISKIFSNFTTTQKKVLSYKLNPPFDVLLKAISKENVTNGRSDRT